MEGQFEHDLYKKSFCNQLQSDETILYNKESNGGWWLLIGEVQYLTMFMNIAWTNFLVCIVKLYILKCKNWWNHSGIDRLSHQKQAENLSVNNNLS